MKKTTRLLLLASLATAAGFLSACQSASMIPAVDSRSFAAVPTVLQANPDLLGGLVGREAVSANPTTNRHQDDKTQRAQLDQRAYLIWKHSQNS